MDTAQLASEKPAEQYPHHFQTGYIQAYHDKGLTLCMLGNFHDLFVIC